VAVAELVAVTVAQVFNLERALSGFVDVVGHHSVPDDLKLDGVSFHPVLQPV
jgi:hypothetical protein